MHIIYSDSSIVVVNKPSGVISIPDGYDPSIPHLRSILEPEFGRLWIVHRLDKETSGVMILARSAAAHKKLCQQFTMHSIHKEYSALIAGICPESFSNESALLVNGDRRHRTVVDSNKGKPALTEFVRTESFFTGTSQLSAYPHTGYSHQIRTHLFQSGFPILGDPLYATLNSKLLSESLCIHRTALHAYRISFIHPENNEERQFTADFPDDYQEMISRCKKNERL